MSWFGRSAQSGGSPAIGGQPVTYADWSKWFEAFANGGDDDDLLARAAHAVDAFCTGNADNLARRASETLAIRLDGIGTMLQSSLRRTRSDQDAVRAILQARGAFVLLRRYAELPCWPVSLRSGLLNLVEQHVSERQKALLKSADEDRSGRLAAAIRKNPLDRKGLVAHRPVPPSPSSIATSTVKPSQPLDSKGPRRPLLI